MTMYKVKLEIYSKKLSIVLDKLPLDIATSIAKQLSEQVFAGGTKGPAVERITSLLKVGDLPENYRDLYDEGFVIIEPSEIPKAMFTVAYYEYERGWGKRLMDTTTHNSLEEAVGVINTYNSKNTSKHVPDQYFVAQPHNFTIPGTNRD